MNFKVDESQNKLTWRINFCFKSNWLSELNVLRLNLCGWQILKKWKTFETVMIISFPEVLLRRLESILSYK